MTTNKPEAVAVMYRDGSVLTKQECGIAFNTCCNVETPLIRLSDYEALQAECEKLRKDAERYRWLRSVGREQPKVVAYNAEAALDCAVDAAMQADNP